MSDSNWGGRIAAIGCVAAILLIVWGLSVSIYSMGWASGLHQAEAQGYAAEYPADTKKRIAECLNGGVTPNSAKCIEEAIASSHESQRSEQDLQAQRDMSEWAFWMLVVAGASLAVTAIGTVFLAWQVSLTRQAVEDTGGATRAMVRQNELTEAAQRPWLSIKCTPVKLVKRTGSISVEIYIHTTNRGVNPAINYQLRHKMLWSHDGHFEEIEAKLKDFDPGEGVSRKTVIPGDTEKTRFYCHIGTSQETFGSLGHVYGILVVSAFYKKSPTESDWYRTDTAYIIGWLNGDQFTSTISDVEFSKHGDDLILEPMVAATLTT